MLRTLLAGTALAALAFAAAPPASATLQFAIDVGGTVFTCVDNAACDTDNTVGILAVGHQLINGLDITGSTQTSTGTVLNPLGGALLNTSSLQIFNTTANTIAFAAAIGDNNFIGPVNQYSASSSATFQSAIGSTLTQTWYDDPANAQGANNPTDHPGNQLTTTTKLVTLSSDATSFADSGAVNDPNNFSMTETITGTLIGGGTIVNNGLTETKVNTPEPFSLAVLGVGLLGLGIARKKRAG